MIDTFHGYYILRHFLSPFERRKVFHFESFKFHSNFELDSVWKDLIPNWEMIKIKSNPRLEVI